MAACHSNGGAPRMDHRGGKNPAIRIAVSELDENRQRGIRMARRQLQQKSARCWDCGKLLQEEDSAASDYGFVFRGRLLCVDCVCQPQSEVA